MSSFCWAIVWPADAKQDLTGCLCCPVQLADQLLALRTGSMTPQQFAQATSSSAMAAALAKTQLPGKMVSPGMLTHLSGTPIAFK